jgi:hypothetical protein
MIPRTLLLLLALVVLLVPVAAATGTHYVPQAGDRFQYYETTYLTNGAGNYTGYSQYVYTNGSLGVTAVATNGTESATYSNSESWFDTNGASGTSSSSGAFTFSAVTFLYVQGTDNQTGYTNPYVWFYMDNSLTAGSGFTVLNTPMRVVSTNVSYQLGAPPAAVRSNRNKLGQIGRAHV